MGDFVEEATRLLMVTECVEQRREEPGKGAETFFECWIEPAERLQPFSTLLFSSNILVFIYGKVVLGGVTNW